MEFEEKQKGNVGLALFKMFSVGEMVTTLKSIHFEYWIWILNMPFLLILSVLPVTGNFSRENDENCDVSELKTKHF